MVGAAAGDDLVALGEAAHRLDLLGDLDRGFDGLGATGDEEEPAEVARCELGKLFGQLDRGCGRVGHRRGVAQASSLVGVRLRDLAAAMPGVDDPQSGDAVEILPAMHVVEASAFTAVEDAEVVTFELGPRQLVDPDVVARGLLHRRRATRMPVFLSRGACSPLPCFDLFGCLRAHHQPVPPGIDRPVNGRRQA